VRVEAALTDISASVQQLALFRAVAGAVTTTIQSMMIVMNNSLIRSLRQSTFV